MAARTRFCARGFSTMIVYIKRGPIENESTRKKLRQLQKPRRKYSRISHNNTEIPRGSSWWRARLILCILVSIYATRSRWEDIVSRTCESQENVHDIQLALAHRNNSEIAWVSTYTYKSSTHIYSMSCASNDSIVSTWQIPRVCGCVCVCVDLRAESTVTRSLVSTLDRLTLALLRASSMFRERAASAHLSVFHASIYIYIWYICIWRCIYRHEDASVVTSTLLDR